MPLGRVVCLIGGLALVASYFMPWFGTQGIVLTGEFLGRFLGANTDLSRFMPGSSGDPTEAKLLRALVHLFPASGLLAAALSVLFTFKPAAPKLAKLALAVFGLIPLIALVIGTARLPPGASQEVGLRVIAAGSIAILFGAGLDALLLRQTAPTNGLRYR